MAAFDSNEIENYYAKRALEYENIYLLPERQEYIKKSKALLKKYFENKNVLEIACGTGYWTETISEVSKNIFAIDINNEVLEIARNKKYHCKVDFIQDDTYELGKVKDKYESIFAGFWFSHIPKARRNAFFDVIHGKLHENGSVICMDNLYVEGSSSAISGYDAEGNSYQIRKLQDNSQFEILKNFYTESELKDFFSSYSGEINIDNLKYYWILNYTKGSTPGRIAR